MDDEEEIWRSFTTGGQIPDPGAETTDSTGATGAQQDSDALVSAADITTAISVALTAAAAYALVRRWVLSRRAASQVQAKLRNPANWTAAAALLREQRISGLAMLRSDAAQTWCAAVVAAAAAEVQVTTERTSALLAQASSGTPHNSSTPADATSVKPAATVLSDARLLLAELPGGRSRQLAGAVALLDAAVREVQQRCVSALQRPIPLVQYAMPVNTDAVQHLRTQLQSLAAVIPAVYGEVAEGGGGHELKGLVSARCDLLTDVIDCSNQLHDAITRAEEVEKASQPSFSGAPVSMSSAPATAQARLEQGGAGAGAGAGAEAADTDSTPASPVTPASSSTALATYQDPAVFLGALQQVATETATERAADVSERLKAALTALTQAVQRTQTQREVAVACAALLQEADRRILRSRAILDKSSDLCSLFSAESYCQALDDVGVRQRMPVLLLQESTTSTNIIHSIRDRDADRSFAVSTPAQQRGDVRIQLLQAASWLATSQELCALARQKRDHIFHAQLTLSSQLENAKNHAETRSAIVNQLQRDADLQLSAMEEQKRATLEAANKALLAHVGIRAREMAEADHAAAVRARAGWAADARERLWAMLTVSAVAAGLVLLWALVQDIAPLVSSAIANWMPTCSGVEVADAASADTGGGWFGWASAAGALLSSGGTRLLSVGSHLMCRFKVVGSKIAMVLLAIGYLLCLLCLSWVHRGLPSAAVLVSLVWGLRSMLHAVASRAVISCLLLLVVHNILLVACLRLLPAPPDIAALELQAVAVLSASAGIDGTAAEAAAAAHAPARAPLLSRWKRAIMSECSKPARQAVAWFIVAVWCGMWVGMLAGGHTQVVQQLGWGAVPAATLPSDAGAFDHIQQLSTEAAVAAVRASAAIPAVLWAALRLLSRMLVMRRAASGEAVHGEL